MSSNAASGGRKRFGIVTHENIAARHVSSALENISKELAYDRGDLFGLGSHAHRVPRVPQDAVEKVIEAIQAGRGTADKAIAHWKRKYTISPALEKLLRENEPEVAA